jgi:hypothetical protein
MNVKLVDSLAQIIQTLTTEERKELDSKLSISAKNSVFERFQKWDQISDDEATALQAEFAQEDITFAESILPEYSLNLQQQDYA